MRNYTIKELMPFCSTDETRPSICQPLNQDGATWATDGRVIVRVAEIELPPPAEGLKIPNVAEVWKQFQTDAQFSTMPELPAPFMKPCTDCEGSGECPHCDRVCLECGGSGTYAAQQPTMVGARQLDARFLRKIAALPNPSLAIAGEKIEPLSFKFDGGEGLLMPMRTQ